MTDTKTLDKIMTIWTADRDFTLMDIVRVRDDGTVWIDGRHYTCEVDGAKGDADLDGRTIAQVRKLYKKATGRWIRRLWHL